MACLCRLGEPYESVYGCETVFDRLGRRRNYPKELTRIYRGAFRRRPCVRALHDLCARVGVPIPESTPANYSQCPERCPVEAMIEAINLNKSGPCVFCRRSTPLFDGRHTTVGFKFDLRYRRVCVFCAEALDRRLCVYTARLRGLPDASAAARDSSYLQDLCQTLAVASLAIASYNQMAR